MGSIFPGPLAQIGSPGPQFVIQSGLALLNLWFQNQNRPVPPRPFDRSQNLTAGGGRDLGGFGRGTSPFSGFDPMDIGVSDLFRTAVGDEYRAAEAQKNWNERMGGAITGLQGGITQGVAGLNRAHTDLGRSLLVGDARFNQARGMIDRTMVRNVDTATSTIDMLAQTYKGFKDTMTGLYARIDEVSAKTMDSFKEQIATHLQNASIGIGKQTVNAASDIMAESRARGMPEAQTQSIGAQILASGAESLNNTLVTLSGEAEKQYSGLLAETGRWTSDLVKVNAQMDAELRRGLAGEAGATMRNLSAQQTQLAGVRAGLEDAAASWRGGVLNMQAEIRSFQATLLLEGNIKIAEFTSTIEDPLILMGDIVGGIFQLNLGLENYQYQLDMQYYTGVAGSMDQAIQSINAALGRLGAIDQAPDEGGGGGGFNTGGAVGGAASMAAQGAVVGSIVPGIGTLAGALYGGAAGALQGGFS